MTWDGLLNALGALVVVLVAYVTWLLLDDYPPVNVDTAPLVIQQPVRRLDALKVVYRITVNRDCSGDGQRVITDAANNPWPQPIYSFNTGVLSDGRPTMLGKTLDEQMEVTVPNGAAPGKAVYTTQVRFYCNWLQRALHRGILFAYPDANFVISEDEPSENAAPNKGIFKRTSYVPSWTTQAPW